MQYFRHSDWIEIGSKEMDTVSNPESKNEYEEKESSAHSLKSCSSSETKTLTWYAIYFHVFC